MKPNAGIMKLLLTAAALLAAAAPGGFAQTSKAAMPETSAVSADYDAMPDNPDPDIPEGDRREEDAPMDPAAFSGIRPLGEVLKAQWPKLSDGSAGITRVDLEKKMQDPSIKDEDAAALVVLVKKLHKKDDMQLDLATALDLVAGNRPERDYKTAVVKLRRANRALFANGAPDFEKMKQGHATDCYFFSGTGWVAKHRPDVIVKAIKKTAKGYKVTFPNGDEAELAPPTDSEIAINDSSATLTDGVWMSVLVKAEGIIEGGRNARRAAIADPTMRVNVGGGPRPIVQRWTGSEPVSFHLGENQNPEPVRKALKRMQKEGLMAEVFAKKASGHIAGNHCYAIFGYNADTDMVTIWNPWGDNFTPAGPEGPEFGYARRHGIFHIPFDEFMKRFFYMSVEGD